ncbi:16989_t:CDS:10 [Dentiscutata heterogama]|uniref:16989_t:CDS:1 n=1 Tax=Dentiscutata heterogama TaxID=1316150 RepID=A0ACA9L8N3_9GLOM|nr:16989_t:CDS:10 [Dentiscutata heterogama]
MTTGQGLFRDDNLMLMHREGYVEECYFSYTLSPIFEADGSVNGVFNAVQETTQRILATRRLKTLGELGNRTPGAKTIESSCHMVATTLRDNNEDIPFAIIYLIESDESNNKSRIARLISTTYDEGLEIIKGADGVDEFLISSNVQATSIHDISFYLQQVVRTGEHEIITLSNGSKAILLPVATSTGKNVLTSVMICGINPRRALDPGGRTRKFKYDTCDDDDKAALSHDAQLFNSRELYLEESHQWIQTKQRPDYDDNDPDVVMQGEGDKDAMDIDDDFEADLGKRMSMSSIDDEKTKKYQFPFDDVSNQTFANHEIMAYAAADPNEQNMKGLKFQYTYGGDIQAEAEAAAAASSESIKPLLEHIIKDSLDYSRETDVTVVLKVSLDELDGESSTSDENVKKGKLCVEVIDSGIGYLFIHNFFIVTYTDMIHSSGRSKRVLIVDYSFLSRQTLVKLVEGSVERVNPFSSCEECITAVKAWREQYKDEALYDIVFFNVRENNSEEIKNAAKELRRICDDNLCIVLIVFWSANGRALGQNLVQEIGGKTCIICKPVMQKRLLHCLFSKDFVSEPYAPSIQNEYYSSVKPLADLRIEDFYRNNRPPFSEEKDLTTAKESSSAEKSQLIVTSEETAKSSVEKMESDDLPKVYVPDESTIKGKGKSVEPTQLGVKRTANDEVGNTSASNDDRASKYRFRPVSKSKCILCVEDNPINLKVIQHQLSKLGYPSLCATNGQEAVNLIESEYSNYTSTSEDSNPGRISLILMDCAMPIMSGFDASRAIRAMNTPISNVPIIALTASAVQGTKEQCLESGMNDYLTKPLKIAKLKEMLEQWLGTNESNE